MLQKIRSISAFGLVFACILFSPLPCLAWRGKVVSMLDADLLVISHESQTDKIKLYGIACPKKGQPFWQQSRALVSYFALQKIVEVTPVYKGSDGLENALVRVEGFKDYLNLQLISHGLAWVKPNECSVHMCVEWREIENLAKTKAIGLWKDPTPIPPWLWEKEQRLQIHKREASMQEKSSE